MNIETHPEKQGTFLLVTISDGKKRSNVRVYLYLLSQEDDGQLLGELLQTVLQSLPQADNNPIKDT